MSARRAKRIGLCALVAILGLIVVGSLPASPPPGGQGNGRPGNGYAPFVPGELLVKFNAGTGPNERANVRAQLNAQKVHEFRSRAEHWRLPEGRSVEQAIAGLRNNPHVRYAEPNYIVEMEIAPNDTLYPQMWGLNNTGQTGGTPGKDIDAERAWNVSTGSSDVMVAVIDTGVDYTHPDLAANIWTNPGEIEGNGIDDDGNGYIDDIHGWDFYNNDNDPFDDNGHGSHCSGTIGAVGDNGIGTAGVAWDVTIVGLKFLSAGGSGSTAAAVSAIDYATALGVDIMSNSWGGGGFSQTLLDAIDAAGAADIVFVAAAGNSSADTDVTPHYPSAYPLDNIIAVMAVDHDSVRSYWPGCACSSNIGATTVDIAAPGTDICSTVPGASYDCTYGGTSMATPHVSGAAALLRSVVPTLPAVQVKQVLMDLGTPEPNLVGQCASGKRLNAFFPIADPDDTPPGTVDDLATTGATSNSLFLGWSATGDDGETGTASTYDMRYSTGPIDDMNFDAATQVTGEPSPGASGTAESMEVLGLDPGTTYYFAVKAADEWGNSGPLSNVAMGMTLAAPVISTSNSPDPLEFNLLTGQAAVGTITIDNVGPTSTLDWNIPLPSVNGPVTAAQPSLPVAKGEADPRVGDPVVEGFGGPDMFGYRWIDSDEPGGPTFTWNDISLTGTTIVELDGDDEISDPIQLGFDFSFYGNTYDSVRVHTNGWMSFTSTTATGLPTYSNQPLPTSDGPENLIAPFWDDLHFRSGNRATWSSDGSSFIVQYTDVDRYTTGSNLTFQMELRSTGEIYYRYYSVSGVTNDCTVGIQNATKDDGLTVAFNTDYLHDGLEVRIAAVPQWMTASPTSGRLYDTDPAASVTVDIDATGLDGGTYEGSVFVESNDPLNPTVEHPVTLYVTGAPSIQVVPTALDFGHVFIGFPETLQVQVNNTGTDELTVSSIVSGDPTVTVVPSSFSVPAHQGQTVDVTFDPIGPATLSSMLTITSDASNATTVDVSLDGSSSLPPDMIVGPTSFSDTLYTGGTSNHTLNISNIGAADLEVTLTVDLGEAPGASHVTVYDELLLGGDDVNGEEADPRPGILGAGGPDLFGYTWTDSDEPGGPVFDWVEISDIGTWVQWNSDNYCGSCNVGPFPLGFNFPFYGDTFNEVRASVTGFLSFTSSATSGSNQPLPNSGSSVPENLLAVFWDSLYSRNGTGSEPVPSGAYYYSDGNRFIFQYDTFYRSGDTDADLDFEVILYRSGKIVYQYKTMANALINSATIGFQNATKDDGLTVVYNDDYVHDNLAIEAQAVPEWLLVDPTSATIPPGGSQDFTVTFDAGDSGDAVFNGSIDIVSVDPPIEVSVPATLTVIGVADAATDPTAMDFGTKFVGYPYTESLLVQNVGTGALTVSAMTSDDPNLIVLEPVSGSNVFVIPPGESLEYHLRWLSPSPYTMAATVTVETDDPDEPVLYVPVTGDSILPPIFGYTPGSFHADLYVEETAPAQTLTLSNTGGSNLDFQIGVQLTDAAVAVYEDEPLAKGEEPKVPGPPQPLNAGGPDMFGYRWKDSDEVGGPVFDWSDISTIGTPIPTGSSGDDVNFQDIPIGFSFPFYGNDFTTVNFSTNGFLSFTSTSSDLSNSQLPGTGSPENLLAVFHDDLDFNGGTKGHYYNDGTRFIVQWTDVEHYPSSSSYTFQAILYPSGKIIFQYLAMSGVLNSHTIGIQNATRDDGLQVVYNSDTYIHDNLAIQFLAVPEWITVSQMAGTLPPGGSVDIDVVLSAVDLIGGDYTGGLTVHTNDPANPSADVPVTMHVTGYPAIAADPVALDFGTVFVGVGSDLTVDISNTGSDVLDVTNIAVSGDYSTDTTPFSLAVGASKTLTVTFAPTDDGTRAGSIDFTSNATGVPTFTVPLTGEGLYPPIAGVDPTSIETALPPFGGSKTKEVDLCNTGGSDLIWTAQTSDVTVGAATVHAELVLAKGDDVAGIDEEVDLRPSILGSGGPDMFGYSWTDSDEPGGPVYDWVDISGVGTPVWPIGTYHLDANEGPFPLGFNFQWYENTFNELYITTEGWISFTSTSSAYSNQPLPNSGSSVPENLIAALWDDLVHRSGTGSEPTASAVYYYNDGGRFIIQWDDMYPIANYTNALDFEIILYPNGRVVYQYQMSDLGSHQNSFTIGWQNQAKDDGHTIVHNDASYLHDNMAIEISAGPDWINVSPEAGVVPAGECSTLTVGLDALELDEGDHDGLLAVLNNDPFNSLIEVPVQLHVAEVDLDYISVEPNTLNLSSPGRYVKAVLQLPAPYDPHDIVIESVSIFDQLYAELQPIGFVDENNDGVQELMVKFDRQAFEDLVPEGDAIPVTITGEVRDTIWFTGTDIIRTIRPHVDQPNGGEYLVAGQSVDIVWTAPASAPVQSYSVWLSRDGTDDLEEVATGVTGTSFTWTITGPATMQARVVVFAEDQQGVMGFDISDAPFTITDQLYPPNAVSGLRMSRDSVDMSLEWNDPPVDLQHGPPSGYQVLRATSPQGPWTEIASPVEANTLLPLDGDPGAVFYYKIVAVNPAGQSAE